MGLAGVALAAPDSAIGRAARSLASAHETASGSAWAMGTFVRIEASGAGAREAVGRALARFAELEALLDPARPSSDVARLALAAGSGEPLPVSPDTIALLTAADEVHRLSGGAFDLTVGPLVTLWGFGSGAEPARTAPPDAEALARALSLVAWEEVSWDPATGTARLGLAGQTLATGGIAKGYALDDAAAILRNAGVRRALLDAGGSLYLLGARDDEGRPWRVGVRHPRGEGYIGVLEVPGDRAVATSGDYERYFEAEGVRYHHILDPRTGRPARQAVSVTVVGPSATLADALSTALFVLGPEEGLRLLEGLPGYEALFVDTEGRLHMTPGIGAMFRPVDGGGSGG